MTFFITAIVGNFTDISDLLLLLTIYDFSSVVSRCGRKCKFVLPKLFFGLLPSLFPLFFLPGFFFVRELLGFRALFDRISLILGLRDCLSVWSSFELRLIFKRRFVLGHWWSRWVFLKNLTLASALSAEMIWSSQDCYYLLTIQNYTKSLKLS